MATSVLMNLEGNIYSCKHCQSHLALSDDVVSKSFYCTHGKAYLFSKVVNVTVGEEEERMMITGMHTIGDIFCVGCGAKLGWKYLSTNERAQKYKEGKFILERYMLFGPDGSSYDMNPGPQGPVNVADDA